MEYWSHTYFNGGFKREQWPRASNHLYSLPVYGVVFCAFAVLRPDMDHEVFSDGGRAYGSSGGTSFHSVYYHDKH